jgi:hypothetical protein
MSSQSPHAFMSDLFIILKKPVTSFVYSKFSRAYPEDFSAKMQEYLNGNHNIAKAMQENPSMFDQRDTFIEHIDIHGALHLIDKGWSDIFTEYPTSMQEDTQVLLEQRNAWAHQQDFSLQDVEEVATIAIRFLNKVGTTSAKRGVKKIRQLLRHDYYRHIPPPAHYIPRSQLIETIKTELLQRPSSILALHGMGGIGKSSLLRALCDDVDIQNRFTDGILWMTFGREVGLPHLEEKLREWIRALNGMTHDIELGEDALRNYLAQLLTNKACLLILDDVWTKEQLTGFNVAGTNCQVILSTRDAEIAREGGAKIVQADAMSDTRAIELLEKWAQGKLENELQHYKELIVQTLGALPLAIKLAGAQLQIIRAEDWLKTYKFQKLKSKRPSKVRPHDSLEKAFALSFEGLSEHEQQLYTALIVFMAQAIPEQTILLLWNELTQLDSDEGKELVSDLASRALCDLQVDSTSGIRSVVLHPLLRSFLVSRLDATETQQLHLALVSAYERLRTHDDWHTVPDDEYFYQYFPLHLKHAGKDDQLRQILLSYKFLQAKLLATSDVYELLTDYDLLRDPPVPLVQHAIRESESILSDSPEQLAECLYTQLMIFREQYPDLEAFLSACYNINKPKLFPIQSPFLTLAIAIQYYSDQETHLWQAGKPLSEYNSADLMQSQERFIQALPEIVKHIQEETSKIPPDPRPFSYPEGFYNIYSGIKVGNENHIADASLIVLAGDFVLSPGIVTTRDENDNRLAKDVIQIFNWQTGESVGFIPTGKVTELVVTGDFLLSAASEGAIKVWNWKTNEEIRTIAESSGNLVGLALSGDYVAVATDMSVTIWNWQTGVAFCAFNEDKSRFLDVSLVEDEIAIVTSDNIVDIWNWRTGKNLNSIEELEGAVLRTHLKGELVLCILEDQTLKIWNWRTMQLVATIQRFRGQISDIISTDKLLTIFDNQLHFWGLKTGNLIACIYVDAALGLGATLRLDVTQSNDVVKNIIMTPNFERCIVGTRNNRLLFLQPNPALMTTLQDNL